MRFEIEAKVGTQVFSYMIAFEFPVGFKELRIAEERLLVDGVMRDVAASAPGDQDLRAQRARAVQGDHLAGPAAARGLDGGHQARGAGADDGHARLHSGPALRGGRST